MHKKGLTLIEILVSIVIFSVVLLGAMAFYFYSDSSFRFAEHKKMALELADARMEKERARVYSAISSDSESVTIGQLTGLLNVYVTDQGSYKLVRIEVAWSDPSRTGTQNIALETYIAP